MTSIKLFLLPLACLLASMQANGLGFSKRYNWKDADAALQDAGMRADNSPEQTNDLIERFPLTKYNTNIQREMEKLKSLTNFWGLNVCDSRQLRKSYKTMDTLASSEDVCQALKDWVAHRRVNLIDYCMGALAMYVNGWDFFHVDDHEFMDTLDEAQGRFSGVTRPSEMRYTTIKRLFRRFEDNSALHFSYVYREMIKPLRLIHGFVQKKMRELGVDSYPLDEVRGRRPRGSYAGYLTWEKLKNHMNGDIRKFIESRDEIERKLLRTITKLWPGNNTKDLPQSQIKSVAKSEKSKPDIIKSLGISEDASGDEMRKALDELLGRACASADEEAKAMFFIAGVDIYYSLPLDVSLQVVAATCYWKLRQH